MMGRRFATALALAALASAVIAQVSRADAGEFGVASASASLSNAKAGGHPDFTTSFEIKTDPASAPNAFGLKRPYAITRDVVVGLPPGLIGNPNAVAQCTFAQLVTYKDTGGGCPNASQVGVSTIYAYALTDTFTEPIYMMKPPGDGSSVARLGLIAGAVPTLIEARVNPERDYGVDASLEAVSGLQELVKAETTLWGIPAAKAHDTERQTPAEAFNGASSSPPRPPGGTPAPFLTNPTRCGALEPVSFSADSYQAPGRFSVVEASLPPLTGCDQVFFSPGLTVKPTSRQAGVPSGLDATLTLPQDESAGGVATSELRNALVRLPEGMTIAAGAADGLGSCSAAQAGFHSQQPARCPDAAKIGDAEITSPALSRVIDGAIYQRAPEPGRLFGIWLVIDELGVHAALEGKVDVDRNDGQITSLFLDNPQLPVSKIALHFRSGARAPLANPPACGGFETEYEFTPWSGRGAIRSSSPMTIDEGCQVGGFAPKLAAGSTNPLAGAFSDFVAQLIRESGEENVAGIDLTLPPGVLARLAGVELCEGPGAQEGNCPAASRVGSVVAATGPGPSPLWIPQPGKQSPAVYLTGPYEGAPYGLAVVVPAQAGPFDLGTVVTRAAIYVDAETARVTIKSDPLPQMLEGVPISYRTISVDIDRPQFTLNPTSCREMQALGRVVSAEGSVATPTSRFQVGGCRELPFGPKLSVRVLGKTNRGAHPRLVARLTARAGDANIARAQVSLPRSEFLDQSHIRTVCTRVQFAANQCPAGSVYGHATAATPLLDGPLKGNVYLRSSAHQLPDLVVALRGQVDVNLVGRIDSVHGGIRTTFESVPDAPVEKFTLTMQGGRKGLLVNSRNLCSADARVRVSLKGHNGESADKEPLLRNSCPKAVHRP